MVDVRQVGKYGARLSAAVHCLQFAGRVGDGRGRDTAGGGGVGDGLLAGGGAVFDASEFEFVLEFELLLASSFGVDV